MRYIFPAILILASLGLFFVYTNPTYKALGALHVKQAAYDEALTNSKKLLDIRNTISDKFNTISDDDKAKLMKLMPDNVDNIRLIIDIQSIARQYGMLPRDIKFDPASNAPAPSTAGSFGTQTAGQLTAAKKDYGTFELEFSVAGTYENFTAFIRNLETSLRLVDIESIGFSSMQATGNTYKYTIKIKTYWLKN